MTTGPAATPTVPPGPGVRPPFVAAPIEGRSGRRWLTAGLLAGLLAGCCGVGTAAFGGLVYTLLPAMNEQAQRAVGDYLDALVEGDWEQAYDQICDEDRQAESLAAFTDRVSRPRIESYELGELEWADLQSEVLELPAEVVYSDGDRRQQTYPLAPDPDGGGRLQVCEHG
jgi:hypothetical protein